MIVDSNLPVERDRLKNRLIRLVKEDNDIVGCFFGGSIGTKRADNYSNIDARIVLRDGINTKKKQLDIIHTIGEILFIESFREDFSIIHYVTFIKLDLYVYTESTLQPSLWIKEIDIVKDNGLIQRVMEYSQSIQYRASQEDFDLLLNRYYANYFELYRCWKRGEINHLEFISLAMKQSLVSLWYMAKGICPNQLYDWSKYEGQRSQLSHLEKAFLASYTPLDIKELSGFTKEISILMLEVAEKVAVYNNLNFSRETFQRVHKKISFS
ncbi:hypothetical protein ACWOAH_08625 [Vagococcus vulneris]|uniref:Uncharacterized protein n=1 Tax=Vagococcus vulneris TaxID=1977869 RepID=A0A429ZX40_9ENTE|nr:hypothetical protein [Vagococcus vulneris]RST98416.1 hypothetical protein CBF37_07840 [Vagococcus vulneris]